MTFFSENFYPAECNYEIVNKNLYNFIKSVKK